MNRDTELAMLAGASYESNRHNVNKIPVPQEWASVIIAGWPYGSVSHPSTNVNGRAYWQDTTTGFEAAAYTNGSEIVISFAGTNFAGELQPDMVQNNLRLGAGELTAQLKQAVEFVVRVQQSAAAQGKTVTLTGHSLGGGLASLAAVFLNVQAVVFDPAPFRAAASEDNAPALRTYLQEKGLGVHTELDSYSTGEEISIPLVALARLFGPISVVGGFLGGIPREITIPRTIPRESNVRAVALQGEFLTGQNTDASLRNSLRIYGNELDLVLTNSGAGALDLHSQALLALMLASRSGLDASNGFYLAAQDFKPFLGLLFDKRLFDKQDVGQSAPTVLEHVLRHQFGVGEANPNGAAAVAADQMLHVMGQDLAKLGRPTAGFNEYAQTGVLASVLRHYYTAQSPTATPQRYEGGVLKQLLTVEAGGVSFKVADVEAPGQKLKSWQDFSYAILGSSGQSTAHDNLKYMNEVRTRVAQSERVAVATNGALSYAATADALNDLILGANGADTLSGGSGNDVIYGGGGDDELSGGVGSDLLIGGLGFDIYRVGAGDAIHDQDGKGRVLLNDQDLTGVFNRISQNRWQGRQGEIYTRVGNDLLITLEETTIRVIDGHMRRPDKTTTTTATATAVADANALATERTGTGTGALGLTLSSELPEAPEVANTYTGLAVGNYWVAGATRLGGLYQDTEGADLYDMDDGMDTVLSQHGDDQFNGKGGSDLFVGGAGTNVAHGGAGDDTLVKCLAPTREQVRTWIPGTWTYDPILGLYQQPGHWGTSWQLSVMRRAESTLYDGTVHVYAMSGTMDGNTGNGNDRLFGGDGSDWLWGAGGNDWLDGGADEDMIFGGAGDDDVTGGSGADILSGDNLGALALSGLRHGRDVIDGGDGDDKVFGNGGEDVIMGGHGHDALWGDDEATPLEFHGADTVDAGEGDDKVYAGGGDDLVDGGGGRDLLVGGEGADRLYGRSGDDRLVGDLPEAEDAYSDTKLYAHASSTLLAAWRTSAAGLTTIVDSYQADAQSSGNDWLDGGAGNDVLVGGAGDDELIGGSGDDVLDGGEGDDRYHFKQDDGADVIQPTQGSDTLNLGPGLTPCQTRATRQGDDLTLTWGRDSVRWTGFFSATGADAIAFEDGTVWDRAAVLALRRCETEDNRFFVDGWSNGPLVIFGDRSGSGAAAGYWSLSGGAGGGGDDVLDGSALGDLIFGDGSGGGEGQRTGSGGDNAGRGGRAGGGDDRINGGAGNDLIFGDGFAGGEVVHGLNVGGAGGYGGGGSGSGHVWASVGGGAGGSGSGSTATRGEAASLGPFTDGGAVAYSNGTTRGGAGAGVGTAAHTGAGRDGTEDTVVDALGSEVYQRVLADLNNGQSAIYTQAMGSGADLLDGGAGDDWLLGGGGGDELVGGTGNDTLDGGQGNDTYRLGVGDGQDVILARANGGDDQLMLGAGLDAAGLQLQRLGADLRLAWASGEAITVRDYFTHLLPAQRDGQPPPASTLNLVFADGSTWRAADIQARLGLALFGDASGGGGAAGYSSLDGGDGGSGADTLVGTDQADLIFGDGSGGGEGQRTGSGGTNGGRAGQAGGGDDTLRGGAGNDLIFGDGFAGGEVRSGLNVGGAGGYGGGGSGSGNAWASVGGGGGSTYSGTASPQGGASTLGPAASGGAALYSNGANRGGAGAGVGTPGTTGAGLDGNQDQIRDTLSAEVYQRVLADLDNRQSAIYTQAQGAGHDTLDGGAGDDWLVAGGGDDQLYGGTGQDRLLGGLGNDRYHFSLGDGQDRVWDAGSTSGGRDVVMLGQGITLAQLAFSRSGNDLLLNLNGYTDSLTVEGWFSSADQQLEAFQTLDGQEFTAADVAAQLASAQLAAAQLAAAAQAFAMNSAAGVLGG